MALVRSMVANGFGYSLGNIHPQKDTAPDGTPLKCVPLHDGLRPMQMGLARRQWAAKMGGVDAFQACCRKE